MIWCVEDDSSIRDIEVYALRSTGFEAEGFEDGNQFWEAIQSQQPELVVLDVMLPGVDGVELLHRVKQSPVLNQIPVIMATAKGAEFDKIQGLDLGADDYLVKPFGIMEMVSRVRAVLRRCSRVPREDVDLGALARELALKVEPQEQVVDALVREIKSRHVRRLRDGMCSVEYGFVLEDLLTAQERTADHCSNVAVEILQVAEGKLEAHEYLNALKAGELRESAAFAERFAKYKAQYQFPEGL